MQNIPQLSQAISDKAAEISRLKDELQRAEAASSNIENPELARLKEQREQLLAQGFMNGETPSTTALDKQIAAIEGPALGARAAAARLQPHLTEAEAEHERLLRNRAQAFFDGLELILHEAEEEIARIDPFAKPLAKVKAVSQIVRELEGNGQSQMVKELSGRCDTILHRPAPLGMFHRDMGKFLKGVEEARQRAGGNIDKALEFKWMDEFLAKDKPLYIAKREELAEDFLRGLQETLSAVCFPIEKPKPEPVVQKASIPQSFVRGYVQSFDNLPRGEVLAFDHASQKFVPLPKPEEATQAPTIHIEGDHEYRPGKVTQAAHLEPCAVLAADWAVRDRHIETQIFVSGEWPTGGLHFPDGWRLDDIKVALARFRVVLV